MNIKVILAAFILSLSSYALHAQDLIYKKNKDVILGKILEIGVDEIKYKDFKNLDGPTISIAKNELQKIKMESGKETYFTDDMTNSNNYADNKKNAIKIDFLAPMYGQTTFGYERSMGVGASIEFNFGIIGWGVNNYKPSSDNYGYSSDGVSASGAFVRAGYKFIKSPDFYLKGMRYAHVMKGSYVRPELTIGACNETLTYSNNNSYYFGGASSTPGRTLTKQVQFGAIMIDFGKQWVMNNIFLVDYFVGFGYGFSSKKDDKDYNNNLGTLGYSGNNHAFIGPWSSTPFAFTCGLKVGMLIK